MKESVNSCRNEAPTLPSLKTITRGVQIFILFSIVGTLLAFWWKKPMGFEVFLQKLKWSYMLILIPLVWVDYLLGGLRYKLFFEGKYLTRVSLWDCMRSNWANIFMGAVTPMQTGGGPAQLYILWRAGAKVSEGILVSLINFFATMIFFLFACTISLLFLPRHFFGENLISFIKIGYVIVAVYILGVLFALFFPRAALIFLRGFFWIIPIKRKKIQQIRDRMSSTVETGTARFKKAFKEILRYRTWALGIVTGLTIALYLNKFLMGYFIACMIWEDVPFVTIIALQIIQIFLIYFAPTPGASGLAELSSTWLIAYILPEGLVLVYTIIWRFLTTILGAFIGGFVLLFDMRRLDKEGLTRGDDR
ncbi:MAG: flippase-like domain-containing protein [Candidatus Aminicenantes bacterium]|nr:flippase-like domain-containing protein [Candidatus Aminicenantes bacterium]MDH5744496.1 flippase-like domain-containing protein [Candidatus Aminicenantes bacterium]